MNGLPEDRHDPLPILPQRAVDSHKGTFGLALLVGGSRGMAGAIALAGMAALRGGAGLVRLAVPDDCLETVAGFEPSYMTVGLECDRAGRISLRARSKIFQQADAATAVACGPGLGRSPALDALVSRLYLHLHKPLVIDADGLNALAARPEVMDQPAAPRVLTPHPGEFARLVGRSRVSPETSRTAAMELASRCGVIVVLKGHQTYITDGRRSFLNTTGNPGLATGGTGDVLTGLVTALACQALSPLDAARLGVYLHGLAGDLAARVLGQESMTAADVVRYLPKALESYRKQITEP